MKQIIFSFFLLPFLKLQAQDSLTNKEVDRVLSSAINNLDESKFYFVGQLHNNQANALIQTDLLLSLNNKFNVHYDILEYGQSFAFLINMYLETGQDSLLKFISQKSTFGFIKAIKNFNDTVTLSKKIKFYGVDFEGRNNGKLVKKAIEIISEKIKLSTNHPLQVLLNAVINLQTESEKENLEVARI